MAYWGPSQFNFLITLDLTFNCNCTRNYSLCRPSKTPTHFLIWWLQDPLLEHIFSGKNILTCADKRTGINTIAGQCRTNLWPAVPDWPWCWKADAGLKKLTAGKKCRYRTNFSPAFRHLHMIFQHHTALNTSSSRLWTWRVYHFPLPSVCSVDMQSVLFINAGMPDCPASNHFAFFERLSAAKIFISQPSGHR